MSSIFFSQFCGDMKCRWLGDNVEEIFCGEYNKPRCLDKYMDFIGNDKGFCFANRCIRLVYYKISIWKRVVAPFSCFKDHIQDSLDDYKYIESFRIKHEIKFFNLLFISVLFLETLQFIVGLVIVPVVVLIASFLMRPIFLLVNFLFDHIVTSEDSYIRKFIEFLVT